MTITELKYLLRGVQQKPQTGSLRISELEDRLFEIIESKEQKEERRKKNVQTLRDLWDSHKCA